MKLVDAIYNVDRSKGDGYAPLEAICLSLNLSVYDYDYDKIEELLHAYPIYNWICTDSHVGLEALYLGDEAVGATFQSSRKSDINVSWISNELANKVRDFIIQCLESEDEYSVDIIDPNEDIGEYYSVEFPSQLLADDGFFENRPVKVLVCYDAYGGYTTPEEYRREGKSYNVRVPYEDPRNGHLLVQDGNEQRLIRINEFRIPFNTCQPIKQ